MCKEHNSQRYLHFSSVAGEIQSKFQPDMLKEFKATLKKHLSPSGVLEKELIINLLLNFMEEKITDCTLGINLDIVNYLGANKDEKKGDLAKCDPTRPAPQQGSKRPPYGHPTTMAYQQSGTPAGRKGSGGKGSGSPLVVDDTCVSCRQHHSHLFYCEQYIAAYPLERFDMVRKQKACARCLGMKVKLVGRREDWQPRHDKFCKTDYACQEGQCAGKPSKSQFHITVCRHHTQENKVHEA